MQLIHSIYSYQFYIETVNYLASFLVIDFPVRLIHLQLRSTFHALCNQEEHFKSGKQGREALLFTYLKRHLFQSSWPWLLCFSESSTQRSKSLSQKQVPLLCLFFLLPSPMFLFLYVNVLLFFRTP